MSSRPFLRDLALLAAAAAIGWWAHGPSVAVHADTHSSTDAALSFQYGGLGPDGQISLYSPSTRTLYIYPSITRSSNSFIPCLYMVQIDRAGAPLSRDNCKAAPFGH
jgi:hypothetical protein